MAKRKATPNIMDEILTTSDTGKPAQQQGTEVLQRSSESTSPKAKPKGRDRSWDARRTKATYDLPQELIERIRQIAEELGGAGAKVKVNDIARLLLEAGLAQYDAGKLRIEPKPTGFTLFDD